MDMPQEIMNMVRDRRQEQIADNIPFDMLRVGEPIETSIKNCLIYGISCTVTTIVEDTVNIENVDLYDAGQ